MKRWNELITVDEAKALGDGEIAMHIGRCVEHLEAEGMNIDDIKNMIASLLSLGYVETDRRINHCGKDE